jgi:rubredoxin
MKKRKVSSSRICPICRDKSEIKKTAAYAGTAAFPMISVECGNCGYFFPLHRLTGAIVWGYVALSLVIAILVGYFYSILIGVFLALVIWICMTELTINWIVKNNLLERYVTKCILQKAKRMVAKGITQDPLTGDMFENRGYRI